MTENERRIKHRVQLVAASGMFVFFCLLLALTVQLAVMANQKAMLRSLRAANEKLAISIANEADLEQRMKDEDRFIAEWLLRHGH
jgi:hypothetical protein